MTTPPFPLKSLLHPAAALLLLLVTAPGPPASAQIRDGARDQATTSTQAQAPATASKPAALGILSKDEAGALMPATVFFRGQTAPIQARNTAGIRVAPDLLLLTALVDTSGYSTSVKERYQAYFLTELPVLVAGHTLAPGAYGVGFIAHDVFVVMDLGGHELFTAPSTNDTALRRPTPLQILPNAAAPSSYRLYTGRSFIPFSVGESRP